MQGDIKVSNMNTSYHYEIMCCPAYEIQDPTETGIINLTTVSNTTSIEASAIDNFGKINITKSNFLYNEYKGSNYAVINCYTSCSYSNCSFIGNKGNYLFLYNDITDQAVRYYYSGTIESHDPLDSFIYHYTTDKCSATYFYKEQSSISMFCIKLLHFL